MCTTSYSKAEIFFQLLSGQTEATRDVSVLFEARNCLPACSHNHLKGMWREGEKQPQCWRGDLSLAQCDSPTSLPLQPWPWVPYPMSPPQDPPPPLVLDRVPHLMALLGHSPTVDRPAWGPGSTSKITAEQHHSLLELWSLWGLRRAGKLRITLLLCKTSPALSPVSLRSRPSP